MSVVARTVRDMVSVEVGPKECERCAECDRPFVCGDGGLVGWDNLHNPPCRTYECGGCRHVMHIENPRLVERL